ncbi:alcohol dehydrogenase catalytic domain-containing protein [Hoeflea ulvae]|uniref:Alcohol dehydrogenase catalytic domain-containing protein n=1 Tax=Hoeflea ulvae TaxID=2983764 RepID=A0ABT3YEB7_9HYPH|nr:alcohol dehydrogenase catalytic domain-containing protein [Hoeflea ulvae]MCY0094231.1 alcohol dehydrogenase catalytic domain-containing protein [Hoeflea ulvae]
MKALVYTAARTLAWRDEAEPVLPPGECLVRVEAVGICGSDMHAFLGHDERRPAPLILGHEAAGVVVEGPGAGRRVTVNPLATCGKCRACLTGRNNLCPKRQILSMMPRQGAFAEFIAIPAENLVDIPDHVSFEDACLAEPLACGWHGVRLGGQGLDLPLGEARCLVIGGGAIGLGAALALKAQGAADITISEANQRRVQALQSAGEFRIATPDDITAEDPGGYDLVIDGVGFSATRATASRAARPGGVIVHIGLGDASDGLDIRRMTLQEITFIGAYTYTPQDFRDTAAAIFDGRLGALDWPEVRALKDGAQAFADILAGQVSAPKIILKP